MASRGTQSPAKNMTGKNSTVPTALPALPLGASAATSRPTANTAAAVVRNATAKMPNRPGSGTPNASRPSASTSAVATLATPRLVASWAASSRTGWTGVVDSRRRIPRSR